MTLPILVVGASVVDRSILLPHLPREGVTEVAQDAAISAGGKGLNQAVGLARLGHRVHFVTAVGRDADGRWLAGVLRDEGINSPLRVDAPTGFSNILVEAPTGRHVLGTFRGANRQLSTRRLPRRRWERSAAGLFQWEVDDRVNLRLARALHRAGRPLILNPAPVENPQALEAWRPLAPVITPNEIEAAALTGLSRRAAPESLARHLIRNGFPRGVITLGDQGCLWWEGTRMGQRPARRVTAVDCVGAGDSFNAGLLHGLLAGRSLASACDVAQACSAKTVSRAGTAVALPVLRELPKSLR